MYIKTRTCNVYKRNELVMYIIKYFLLNIYSTSTLNVNLKRTITLYTFPIFYYRVYSAKHYPIGSCFIAIAIVLFSNIVY